MGTRLIKCLIILVAAMIFITGCEKQDNTPQIFEIKNTAETSNNPQFKYIEIQKHYMILNAPANLPDLKAVILYQEVAGPVFNALGRDGNSISSTGSQFSYWLDS